MHSVYSTPSFLFIQDKIVQLAEGIQQVDPLGPLLFSLTAGDLTKLLRSELIIFYLDNGTLSGEVKDVLRDLQKVTEEAAGLGLQLNHSKSEIISRDPSAKAEMMKAVPNLCPVTPDKAHFLGTPIGGEEGISDALREKIEALDTMGNMLCHFHAHDAYYPLQHSFTFHKLHYTLRTSSCSKTPTPAFYHLLQLLLGEIVNVNTADSDMAWTQASLPVGSGGLGIRSATQLAPSAFLASAAGYASITQDLLPPRLRETTYNARKDTLQVWSEGLEASATLPADTPRQKVWDAPKVASFFKALREGASDTFTQAHLLAACRKESGAWLQALPVSSLGLRMEDDVFRVAVTLRLGVPLCQPHNYQLCGTPVDEHRTHGLHCRKSVGATLTI